MMTLHQTIQNGVSNRRITDPRVPVLDRQLTGNDGGAVRRAVVNNFKQIRSRGAVQIAHAPVIQNQHISFSQLQQPSAEDAAAVFLYQPQWITVANSKLTGLWQDMPVFVNDLSALRWQ